MDKLHLLQGGKDKTINEEIHVQCTDILTLEDYTPTPTGHTRYSTDWLFDLNITLPHNLGGTEAIFELLISS